MSKFGGRGVAPVALSLVTRSGKPIFLKTFEMENALKAHFIVHAGLDQFDEKQAADTRSYLGLFAHIEDYRLFGYVGNSGVKVILCTDDGLFNKSGSVMKTFLDQVHQVYVDYTSSPFAVEDSLIVSKIFESKIDRLVGRLFDST